MPPPKRSSWTFTATTTGDGDDRGNLRAWSYQANLSGTGAVSATVLIEVRNGNGDWILYGTLSPSGTTTATDSIVGDAPWLEHRARCTAISGTGASVVVSAAGSH
jgi:hypothetical protein